MNGDAPIGFDEMPPETEMLPTSVSGASAFPCRDHAPRTICPALTNGGRIRSMDNHQLAEFLAEEASNAVISCADTEADYLRWLSEPCGGMTPDAPA
ncbi:MAG: hypothetical protein IJT94_04520 [Oscillibacter sp.]|nr:hypothetical protein [Oscillibacter sp.]